MNLSINRIVTAVLIAVLLVLQIQIWTGRGSVQEVSLMKQQLESQRDTNAQLEQQISRIESEIADLKEYFIMGAVLAVFIVVMATYAAQVLA